MASTFVSDDSIGTVTHNDWLSLLCDEIDELLATAKELKFNTHKNRKVFCGKLKNMIINAVRQNTVDFNHAKPIYGRDARQECITRPNANKPIGHAVMTPELSQKGDVLIGVGLNPDPTQTVEALNAKAKKDKEDKLKNQRTGVRKW